MSTTPDPLFAPLDKLVGSWTTEATHPAMPGVVVHGAVEVEWLEGKRFLIHRARTDHPDFPDSLSIIGLTGSDRVDDRTGTVSNDGGRQLRMHYYDSRGVYREFDASVDATAWRTWNESPGFSQRFTGTFADDGDTIVGQAQLRRDGVHWNDDLAITYRRKR